MFNNKNIIFILIVFVGLLMLNQDVLAQSCPPRTEVRGTAVTFVGEVVDTGGDVTYAWFEYGPTLAFGNKTLTKKFTKPSIYCSYVFGLNPCTTYYYRAVAENSAGISYGETKSFTTSCSSAQVSSRNAQTRTTARTVTRVVSQNNNLELVALVKDLSKRGDYVNEIEVTPNKRISVLVAVKSKKNLNDVKLAIDLPEELKFQRSTFKIDNERKNVSLADLNKGINLGDLKSGEERVIIFEALTASKDSFSEGENELEIIAKATYNGGSISDNALVFVNNEEGIGLGAATISNFLPGIFIAAIILLFLILLLIIIFLYLRIKRLMT